MRRYPSPQKNSSWCRFRLKHIFKYSTKHNVHAALQEKITQCSITYLNIYIYMPRDFYKHAPIQYSFKSNGPVNKRLVSVLPGMITALIQIQKTTNNGEVEIYKWKGPVTIHHQWWKYNTSSMVKIQYIINGENTIHHQWWKYNTSSMVKIQYIINGENTMHHQWWKYNASSMVKRQCIINGEKTMHHKWWKDNTS